MRLGLLIRDREYRSAMLEMISEFDREIFVEVADEKGAGRESVIMTDILPEELNSEQLERLKHRTIFLTPSRTNNSDGIRRVFKYEDVSVIMGEVFMLYSEWTGDIGISHPFSKTISVCCSNDSTASDNCKTLARAVLYEHGGSVLILPLGYINDYAISQMDKEDAFRRMMYLIDAEKSFPIEAFSFNDSYGISYLKTQGYQNPIAFLDEEYLKKLIREMCNRFDTVIFDVGTCYRKENLTVIHASDIILQFRNSRVHDFTEIVGSDDDKRIACITEDGVSDITMTLTDIVHDMYETEGVRSEVQ